MMKSLKKPLPAPRLSHKSLCINEDKPPVPERPRKCKHATNNTDVANHNSDSNASLEALRRFALRKDFTESEFDRAIHRTALPVDTDNFLSQLIAVRAEGPQDTEVVWNENVLSARAKEIQANLRNIVIDGSNVAMTHGNGQFFSSRGIQIAVDWFRQRGHSLIKVFIPAHRNEAKRGNRDVDILHELAAQGVAFFTPSRESSNGSRMTCYDDRFILRCASEDKAIVVSNDQYRDLLAEDPTYRETIKQRLLMYTFAGDRFIPAEDPMGRKGWTLDQFLRIDAMDTKTGNCPYGRKCTYGTKCRYAHPEREESAILEETQISIGRQREQQMPEFMHRSAQMLNNNNIKPNAYGQSLIHQMSTGYAAESYTTTDFSNHPSNISSRPSLLSRGIGEGSSSTDQSLNSRKTIQKPVGPQKIVLKRDNGSVYPILNTLMITNMQQIPPSHSANALPTHQQQFSHFPNSYKQGLLSNATTLTNRTSLNHCTDGIPNMNIGTNHFTNHNRNSMPNGIHSSQYEDKELLDESDERNKLYFHLKHLFDKDKVREAMNRLPLETDARLLIQEITKIL